MEIALFVAMDEGRAIGRDGDIPWRLPKDWKWFKRQTMGKPLVMGRRTHESIGRPLPGRRNIVVTRNPDYDSPGCEIAHSLETALALCEGAEEVIIAGGQALYEAALPLATRIYLTEVHALVGGDTFFPEVDLGGWAESWRREHSADERHAHSFTSRILIRKSEASGA